MTRTRLSRLIVLLWLGGLLAPPVASAEWPAYRGNNRRTAVTDETLVLGLTQHWQIALTPAGHPAWPDPAEELPRTQVDSGPHVVLGGGKAFFGSSVTNHLYAVDLGKGTVAWEFATEGPIRFAPALADGKLFAGSDDGHVYCLDAASGKLLWKYRVGPDDSKVIGNGRMISTWPVRTGVVVDDSVVYATAGVFPFEGVFLCALKASDGSVVWRNDALVGQSHSLSFGGISPHGYLLLSETLLYVPSGRAMPAAFDRRTGKLHFYANPGGKRGGAWALLDGPKLIAGIDSSGHPSKVAYDAASGALQRDALGWVPGAIDVAAGKDIWHTVTPMGLAAVHRPGDNQTPQKNAPSPLYRRGDLSTVIRAGNVVLVGGKNLVAAVDANSAKELWSAPVAGRAVALAVSDGRLLVSTASGSVYCFGPKSTRPTRLPTAPSLPTEPKIPADFSAAVAEILARTGISRGFCLVRDCNTAALTIELARKTDLTIVALQTDPKKLATARKNVASAGLLGSRVVVEPWKPEDLPPCFANLIVSESGLKNLTQKDYGPEWTTLCRPGGGTIYARKATRDGLVTALIVRPPLAGGGTWRGLYGNAQNTGCSEDQVVSGAMGVLWFGDPGPQGMVERHGRAAGPVAANGRLFVQGEEFVTAWDAYNGSFLWRREIPGAVRVRADVDGGNLVLGDDALYVAAGALCHRIDAATGKTLATYSLPASPDGAPRRWGYLALSGGVLLGSSAAPLARQYGPVTNEPADSPEAMMQQQRGTKWRNVGPFPSWSSVQAPQPGSKVRPSAGDALFALDPNSGKTLWVYRAKEIPNIAVTADDRAVYLVQHASEAERADAAKDLKHLTTAGRFEPGGESKLQDRDVRVVTALSLTDGNPLWQKSVDLTGCGGDKMGAAVNNGVLLFFGHFSNHDTGLFLNGLLTWRRITALDASRGVMLWSRPLNYLRRPLIVGDEIIIEPRACELKTGKIKMRRHPVSGQMVPWEFLRPGHCCSVSSASAGTLFYRSGATAIYDLKGDSGLNVFGAIRPGCWLNMITSGGVMLMPEASSGCTCSYPVRSSVARVPKPRRVVNDNTVFITHGPVTPVQRMALDFGATGDVRDADGQLWLAWPRPPAVSQVGYGRYGLDVDVLCTVADGAGGFFREDFRRTQGTRESLRSASGCRGLRKCDLRLIDPAQGQKPGRYRVTLNLSPAEKASASVEVRLQGKPMHTVELAPGKSETLTFENLSVVDSLSVELVPQASAATTVHWIEIVRSDGAPLPPRVEPISAATAAKFLAGADSSLKGGDTRNALTAYHLVLEGSDSPAAMIKALDGMIRINRLDSLGPLGRIWVRVKTPILDNYRTLPPPVFERMVRLSIALIDKLPPERANELLADCESVLSRLKDPKLRQQVIRRSGYLTDWRLVGPIPWPKGADQSQMIAAANPINLSGPLSVAAAQYTWKGHQISERMVNLSKLFGTAGSNSVFATTTVTLANAADLQLKIGSDDGYVCWVNGKRIGQCDKGRAWGPAQEVYTVRGVKGANTILLQVFNIMGDWGLSVQAVGAR